jgi:hypothetical protein
VRKFCFQQKEIRRTEGNPRLSPIPANADTSSNITANILNQLLLASIKFPRSMIAMRKMPHTSHHMSSSSPRMSVLKCRRKQLTDGKLTTKMPVKIPADAFARRELFKVFLHVV